ncbi:MAG: hypothetical protein J7K54_04305 [Candidatus Aenigmarchaeota archaeon]|nr:hypothetical protein [Candidatus Aenigmarchaeota archaeon]
MAKKSKSRKTPVKTAIEIIDESEKKPASENVCPVCGAPGGREKCDKCGWCIEELGPDYSIADGDPVTTLQRAERTFKSAKEELIQLRKENKALMLNNQKFAELVESMEKELKRLHTEMGRKYIYSYNAGGWGEAAAARLNNIKLEGKKTVTVSDINKQLAEIMRILRHYKK